MCSFCVGTVAFGGFYPVAFIRWLLPTPPNLQKTGREMNGVPQEIPPPHEDELFMSSLPPIRQLELLAIQSKDQDSKEAMTEKDCLHANTDLPSLKHPLTYFSLYGSLKRPMNPESLRRYRKKRLELLQARQQNLKCQVLGCGTPSASNHFCVNKNKRVYIGRIDQAARKSRSKEGKFTKKVSNPKHPSAGVQ